MNCTQMFEKLFCKGPGDVVFCPYRICPLGAHIDHQHGPITGLAIDKGIRFAYSPEMSGTVELASLNFPERVRFDISAIPKEKKNDWADYLRGAALMLSRIYPLHIGLCGVFEGSLPIGGLSSSSAIILSFLSALCRANDIKPTASQLISVAVDVENKYVGVSCGKLDQSCEILCRKDRLLYLDTEDDKYELISAPERMQPFEIAVFFSGLERSLAGTQYNARVDECKAAAYALMAYAGADGKRFGQARLRDVPREVFEKYGSGMPDSWQKRALHFYNESERVERGKEAWRKGDMELFGRLCSESGESSISLYEAGCPQLKSLYEIIRSTDGVYGGRFSGAGFKGSCIALIDPVYKNSIAENVRTAYLREYPQLADKYTWSFCKSTDGLSLDS